jgi:hypothetical protein
MVFLVIILYMVIAIFQIPGLIHKKYWPELTVFGILLFMSFSLSIFMALGLPLPFISDEIGQGIKYMFKMK